MLKSMEDDRPFKVVVNHEEQYSIWPADRDPPDGYLHEDKARELTGHRPPTHSDEAIARLGSVREVERASLELPSLSPDHHVIDGDPRSVPGGRQNQEVSRRECGQQRSEKLDQIEPASTVFSASP